MLPHDEAPGAVRVAASREYTADAALYRADVRVVGHVGGCEGLGEKRVAQPGAGQVARLQGRRGPARPVREVRAIYASALFQTPHQEPPIIPLYGTLVYCIPSLACFLFPTEPQLRPSSERLPAVTAARVQPSSSAAVVRQPTAPPASNPKEKPSTIACIWNTVQREAIASRQCLPHIPTGVLQPSLGAQPARSPNE